MVKSLHGEEREGPRGPSSFTSHKTSTMQDIRGDARNLKTDLNFPRGSTAQERCITIQLGLLAREHDQL